MKSLLLVVCVFLVMSSAAFAGDWFDLVPSVSDTVQLISDGEEKTVVLTLQRVDQTFNETVYLFYIIEYYNVNKSWVACANGRVCTGVRTPTTSVNTPYSTPAIVHISPKGISDTGLYRVRVTANNGPKSTNYSIYFRVNSGLSRFYKLKDLKDVAKMVITYDTSVQNGIHVVEGHNRKQEYVLGQGKSLRKILYQVGYKGSLSLDKQNNFWWAYDRNLSKVGKIYTSTYTSTNSDYEPSSITTYATNQFAHLSDGTTFAGVITGLFKIKDGLLTRFPSNNTILSHHSVASLVALDDTLWVSTGKLNNGYTDGKIIKYYGDTSINLPTCLKDTTRKFAMPLSGLTNDRNGNLWAGASTIVNGNRIGSIVKFDGVNWITFNALESLDSNVIGKPGRFVFDNHGKMWILTNKHNLIEFDGTSIGQVFESKNTILSEVNDKYMVIDSSNTIYLSNDDGIILFNPDGIPLPSIAATAVEEEPVAEALTGVYPQPAREYVTFELPSESEFNPTTIELLNSAGMNAMPAVTIGAQASGRYTLPTSELPSGLYFAVLHSGKMLVKKPVVVVR